MISKDDIIRVTRHILRREQGYPDRKLMHPIREWAIGLGVGTVLFVIAVAFSGYAFITQSERLDEEIVSDSSVVLYKQEETKDILNKYRTREETFGRLRADRSNVYIPPVVIEEEEEEGKGEEDSNEEGDGEEVAADAEEG